MVKKKGGGTLPYNSWSFTIKYVTSKGSTPVSKNKELIVAAGAALYTLTEEDLPTLSSDGSIFRGWSYEGAIVSIYDTILISSNNATVILTAAWEEILVVVDKSQLINIANSVRSLTNTTETMKLTDIPELLESGEIGGTNAETCTVTIEGSPSNPNYWPTDIAYTTIDNNGNIIYKYETYSSSLATITCLKNSIVCIKYQKTLNLTKHDDILLFNNDNMACCFVFEDLSIDNSNTHSGGAVD